MAGRHVGLDTHALVTQVLANTVVGRVGKAPGLFDDRTPKSLNKRITPAMVGAFVRILWDRVAAYQRRKLTLLEQCEAMARSVATIKCRYNFRHADPWIGELDTLWLLIKAQQFIEARKRIPPAAPHDPVEDGILVPLRESKKERALREERERAIAQATERAQQMGGRRRGASATVKTRPRTHYIPRPRAAAAEFRRRLERAIPGDVDRALQHLDRTQGVAGLAPTGFFANTPRFRD
jgi:hypothetical protein